ncbi:hypothetical protein AIOL_000794 [Candidatus Rhodobacter oscarellae]|uniref:DUF306 domain-containing protein n=1 Tax=Candidatus Rhodobacter oscarellae TaxID=1675527 RepID=A0A0J9ED48_9RHOB|nr:hypothetical protein [Candidatus Rhodobacter lobularis]KMW60630.1 hypothetical protein AIOL_000794 [Candidatus Rhodobacter lobularis]
MRYLALLAVLAATPLSAQNFDGIYRPAGPAGEGWNCQVVGADGGAIAIRGELFQAVGSTCRLTNPIQIRRMEGMLFNGACESEGTQENHRFFLMLTPDGVVALRGDGAVINLARCPS